MGETIEVKGVGLAMAGGGISGAIYEMGALRALDEILEGIDFNDLSFYVGVSAGSFVASCLANGITTGQLCRSIINEEPDEPPTRPELFHTPALKRYVNRGIKFPSLVADSILDYIGNYKNTSLMSELSRMLRVLPSGIFENEPLREFIQKLFSIKGRSNDFRDLKKRLYVVATDLDSGNPVVFGSDEWDGIPISKAVQASTALPGFYPPVEIGGRYYVDGVLLKTMHASVALCRGAELVFCLNPIVPVDTIRSVEEGFMRRGRLVDRGMIGVLHQAVRTMVHSRMEVGMAAYQTKYLGRDVILFEPARDDYRMFFTNIFSFASRKSILEHGYKRTLANFRDRIDELEPILGRHGIGIRRDRLFDPEQDLWEGLGLMPSKSHRPLAVRRLNSALSRLEHLVDELGRSSDHQPEVLDDRAEVRI